VVLQVHATGLCNSDVRVYLGEKGAAPGVIPGHEMSGEVLAAGPAARVKAGDVVSVCPILCCGRCSFCRGGYHNRCLSRKTLGYDLDGGIAERVLIPAQLELMGHLLAIDPAAPAHLRALVEPVACVLNSLESIGVRAGAPLAVVGGGPMGLLHLVLGLGYGAWPVLVVEPDASRRAVALELGATAAVDPADAPAAMQELTRNEGFPAVAMAVGLAEALPGALRLCRRLGSVNLFAGFPPGASHTLDLNRIHYDEVRLVGTQNAPLPLYARAAEMIPRLPQIDRIVTNRYRLDQAAEAYSARLAHEGLKSAVVV
jgi:L-iditol 2-dehydrogenase